MRLSRFISGATGAALAAALFVSGAHAQQAVLQAGPWVQGHIAKYGNPGMSTPTLVDGGAPPTPGVGIFNITDYGALCDGVTNDQTAIQTAETTAQAAGGGMVQIPVSKGCIDNSTLTVTGNNITIAGAQMGGASLIFTGSADDILIGNGRGSATQVNNTNIHDLTILNVGKAGGYTLHYAHTGQSTIKNVFMQGVYNGIMADQINNLVVYNSVINGLTNSPGHGIDFVTAGDGSVRSDVFALTDVAVNMNANTRTSSACLYIDGFSNTIRAKSLALLNCGYGLRIVNSSGTNLGYNPQFGFFQDLEVEAWIQAVRIEAGYEWMFSNSLVDNYHDTNPADPTVEVLPDSAGSITRGVFFSGSQIKTGPGTCLLIDGVHQFVLSGSSVNSCGIHSGPNASGGAQPQVPAIELGANVNGFTASGNNIGYEFGQGPDAAVNYAIQVDSGASQVLLGPNNYQIFDGVAPVNNLSSGSVSMSGGLDDTGAAIGPNYSSGSKSNPGAVNQITMANTGTTTGTASSASFGTGTANAYALIGNNDGATPTAAFSSGAGDTGGLMLMSGAGPVNLQPTGNLEINGTVGVTCPTGSPSSSFASIKGVVTHC